MYKPECGSYCTSVGTVYVLVVTHARVPHANINICHVVMIALVITRILPETVFGS